MRTIPAGFLDSEVTDLAICWRVTKAKSGEVILGTESDADVEITTGNYAGVYPANTGITGSDIKSSSGLEVDNLEVKGALADSDTGDTGDTGLSSGDITIVDLSAADIEAGEYDNAEFVTFQVNVTNPDLYQHVLRVGWTGNVNRTAEGEYRTECRGLTQALSQGIVRTYGVGCDAELGDSRCKVDLTPFTYAREVAVVTNRREFQIDTPLGTILHIPGGKVTWTSGLNTGYTMEIKAYVSMQMELYLPMPLDIQVGDTLTIQQGCDKRKTTCINEYNNILNFRGHGVFVPGEFEILKIGKR